MKMITYIAWYGDEGRRESVVWVDDDATDAEIRNAIYADIIEEIEIEYRKEV